MPGNVVNINKSEILSKVCYTELVYGRINKKLKRQLSKEQIEALIYHTIQETQVDFLQRIGKNVYFSNSGKNMKLTINSHKPIELAFCFLPFVYLYWIDEEGIVSSPFLGCDTPCRCSLVIQH
jgi:hypothetical protein